ncbi:uncharacterized protein LOC120359096 isoform X3 [Solenopsis invicta]|uniref:uncharacterized protein LOC120359096 isoform X3 n=1 Tax=Solenopsis invicta TaxID=13686 RepID=UPI00193E3110|nr:uncharacterized protein LOC120359096 isoform X3 [Solenopsis invicta]
MEEFPEERYYGMNRVLLSTVGLWPDDHYKVRHFRFILLLLIVISLPSSQWIKLFTSEYNSDLLLKILSFNILLMLCPIKYITFYAVFKNIKEFRQRVQNNWGALKDNREIEIICKQGSYGKFFTIFIATFVLILSVVYICTQYVSIVLDIITPLNVSRPRQLLIITEYFIDHEKYFYIISIYLAIAIIVIVTCFIATESFSVINALHAFGLFKIASYRMKHLLSGITPHMCLTKKYIISHNKIIAAVDFHRRAIDKFWTSLFNLICAGCAFGKHQFT